MYPSIADTLKCVCGSLSFSSLHAFYQFLFCHAADQPSHAPPFSFLMPLESQSSSYLFTLYSLLLLLMEEEEEEEGDEMVHYDMESEEDIQELPTLKMKQVEEPSKVRLILDRGWRIGKKIAIIGAAISTAPIILPPLMIFSAFDLAFFIPFSLIFAGYACTDKIMCSLLPPPLTPHAIAPASPEEEPYMKAWSKEMKQEAVHITKIYEDGESGLGYKEDGWMVTKEKKQQAVGTDEGVPLVEKEEDVKVEENEGDVNKEKKGQEGEVIVKEITKNDDRIKAVAGEMRKPKHVPEVEK